MSNNIMMSSENIPEVTKSIEDFIELGRGDDMTYSNFSIMGKIVGGETTVLFPTHNVIYDYINELKNNCVLLEFDDLALVRYRFNPKRLSFDIYGSAELYFIILALNGMCSFKDFNKKIIKVLYKQDMENLLTQIYNAESEYINKNRNKIKNNNL